MSPWSAEYTDISSWVRDGVEIFIIPLFADMKDETTPTQLKKSVNLGNMVDYFSLQWKEKTTTEESLSLRSPLFLYIVSYTSGTCRPKWVKKRRKWSISWGWDGSQYNSSTKALESKTRDLFQISPTSDVAVSVMQCQMCFCNSFIQEIAEATSSSLLHHGIQQQKSQLTFFLISNFQFFISNKFPIIFHFLWGQIWRHYLLTSDTQRRLFLCRMHKSWTRKKEQKTWDLSGPILLGY